MALLGWRFEVSFVDADVDLVVKAIVVSVGGVFFVYIYIYLFGYFCFTIDRLVFLGLEVCFFLLANEFG